MKEIQVNKESWGKIAEDHYKTYKKRLTEKYTLINSIIQEELGDVSGKSLIHLQCNTGADTISLARMGASKVTGVDLAPENVHYAKKLAEDFGICADFIESDVLQFMEKHDEKYDIVFVSEGAIGWLPDLKKWGQTIRHLLKDDGFFYIFDSHPFYLVFDEDKLQEDQLEIQYPYFSKEPDLDDTIGGYASEPKKAPSYFWSYTVSDIINSLTEAGLTIQFFNETDKLYWDCGNLDQVEDSLYLHRFFRGKLPFSFSLKAAVKK